MSGKKTKKRGSSWDEESMKCALEAVRLNLLNPSAAAIRFNIPRRTLRSHLESGRTNKVVGKASVLTKQKEAILTQRIKRFAKMGIPLTSKFIGTQAFLFCEKFKIKNSFSKSTRMAGRKWLNMFLKRNPSISRRIIQIENPARAQKLDKTIVNHYFEEVKKLYQELDIIAHPERLYNMDHNVCRIAVHNQNVADKGNTGVDLVADNATIAMCINAVGSAIPPMVIFKGAQCKPELEENLPSGTKVRMAPEGSMTSNLFVEFIQHLGQHRVPAKCLLIFDSAKCDLTYEALEEADKNNIVLYCFPYNTTHELQPLDKSVNRSYKHHWDQEVLSYLSSSSDRKLNKTAFNQIFSRTWSKCMTHTNIVNGFRDTGLYPFDPDAIPEDAYAPSSLRIRPVPETYQEETDSSSDIPVDNMSHVRDTVSNRQLNESTESACVIVKIEPITEYSNPPSPSVSPQKTESSSPLSFHDMIFNFQFNEMLKSSSKTEKRKPNLVPCNSSRDLSDVDIDTDTTHNNKNENKSLNSKDYLSDTGSKNYPVASTSDPQASTSGLQKNIVYSNCESDLDWSINESLTNKNYNGRLKVTLSSDDEVSETKRNITSEQQMHRPKRKAQLKSYEISSHGSSEDDEPLPNKGQRIVKERIQDLQQQRGKKKKGLRVKVVIRR